MEMAFQLINIFYNKKSIFYNEKMQTGHWRLIKLILTYLFKSNKLIKIVTAFTNYD